MDGSKKLSAGDGLPMGDIAKWVSTQELKLKLKLNALAYSTVRRSKVKNRAFA